MIEDEKIELILREFKDILQTAHCIGYENVGELYRLDPKFQAIVKLLVQTTENKK